MAVVASKVYNLCLFPQPKLSSGLSMKKKGVDSLVAKWQNIQQEVKRGSDK